MIKTAVIGLGVGEHHLRAYQEHPACTPVYACDFEEAKLERAHEVSPGISCIDDESILLGAQGIDLVSVASFDDHHCRQTVAALDAGAHVMVEKPMCLLESEVRAIREALVRNPGLHLSSNVPLRTCPRFARVREEVQGGSFGTVYHLEGDYFWGRSEKLLNGWRTDMDFYSIIMGASVHMVDLVMWITGKKPVAVVTFGSNVATRGSALRYNDFACTMLQFEDGSTAKLSAHGGCTHPHFHGLKVFGNKKTFVQDFVSAYAVESCQPGCEPSPDRLEYPAKELRKEVIHSFVDFLLGKIESPLVPQEDVFDVMSVCLAAEKSMATGEKAIIEYL